MQEDKLIDFERAEFYKTRLKSKNTFVIIFSILMSVDGFVMERAIDLIY